MKMWNTTTLIPPPINSFHAKSVTIDLNAVACILSNGIKSLNPKLYNALRTESLLLSRCVYRMKLQFRCDKGFKCMEKTNTLLKRFLLFDLISDLKSFCKSVPKTYEKDLYLPTKQMLEYVLVRMQGYVQLLKRIGESAVNTAELMNNRLGLGHLWTTAAVVLGLISRIWQICKHFIKKCCIIYNDILPLRDKLEIVGVKWLEDGYEFPPNLTDWLDVNWLHEKTDIISNFQIDLPIFNLLDESDDEDVQYCYQYKLNDCFVVDDSIIEDDDVKWVETSKNKHNYNKSAFIIDDSDASSVEQVDFGGNISDGSEGSAVIIKSDLENTRINSPINLDRTLDVIDVSSMIEEDDDDDIGECVPREEVNIAQNISGASKKKNKNKKKKKNRNLEVDKTNRQFNNGPKKKKQFLNRKKFKSDNYNLQSSSGKIKKKVKHEFKAPLQTFIKKEIKVKKEL